MEDAEVDTGQPTDAKIAELWERVDREDGGEFTLRELIGSWQTAQLFAVNGCLK